MKKNIKSLVIYGTMLLASLSLSGCGSSTPEVPVATTAAATTTEAQKPLLHVSIGTKDNMKDYDYICEAASPNSSSLSWNPGNPDADMLIAIIADLTGWNLTLSEPVSVSPGSFSIYFGEDSSIYTGAVDSSKTDFAITDKQQLVTTILDSIVQNMNTAYDEELTIYFSAADGSDIVVPGTDITISASEPYAAPAEE